MKKRQAYDVTSQLKNIQRIIQQDIPSFIISGYELDQEVADYFMQAVQDEIEAVKAALYEARLMINDQDLRQCIHVHQHQIVTCIHSLSHYTSYSCFSTPPTPPTKEVLFYTVFVALEDLLHFLEYYFPAYFNAEAWLPLGYRLILKEQLLYQLSTIEQHLKTSAVDGDLIKIALSPIYKFVQPVTLPDIDVKTITYLRLLKAALLDLVGDPTLNPSKALHRLLHEHNFNSDEYVQYCIKYMRTQVSTIALTDYEKLHKLAYYHKLICQNFVKTNLHLNPKEEPLSVKLNTWILAEVKSIETYLTLAKNMAQPHAMPRYTLEDIAGQQPQNKTAGPHLPRKQRIRLTISVSDLALCVRIFQDLCIISERNLSEIIRHLAHGTETLGSEEPSYKNIKKSYYSPHQSSYDNILCLCRRITDYIQKQRMSG